MDSNHEYIIPQKEVKSIVDIKKWESSQAYVEYLSFIEVIGKAIAGKKISDVGDKESESVKKLNELLNTLSNWVDEIEPQEQEQRFGNKSYRTWFTKMKDNINSLLENLLPKDLHPSIKEISIYLEDGFGNSTRIDYGTGHEMAFVMFIYCLFRIGFLKENDQETVGLSTFNIYMDLSRKLQRKYNMEPAGSQGVWALDDFQFVSFIWGSAQLIKNSRVKPKSIPDYEIAQMLAPDYHLFRCIKYISEVKTGPFAEHSNQLWNISGVPNWEKVNQGLIKMYRAEVLSKFPVIQHVYFGSLLSLKPSPNPLPAVSVGLAKPNLHPGISASSPRPHHTSVPTRFPALNNPLGSTNFPRPPGF